MSNRDESIFPWWIIFIFLFVVLTWTDSSHTTLTVEQDPIDTVTLTAEVSPARVSGIVKFYTGDQELGQAIIENGKATLVLKIAETSLKPGQTEFKARYTGNSDFDASTGEKNIQLE